MIKGKKSIKEHLEEIFLRQSFIDANNKKELLKECFYHDLKCVLGFLIFLVISVALVLIFG